MQCDVAAAKRELLSAWARQSQIFASCISTRAVAVGGVGGRPAGSVRKDTSGHVRMSYRVVGPKASGRVTQTERVEESICFVPTVCRSLSLSHFTDDFIRFWRSNVKVATGCHGGEGIHVSASWSLLVMTCSTWNVQHCVVFLFTFIISQLWGAWYWYSSSVHVVTLVLC